MELRRSERLSEAQIHVAPVAYIFSPPTNTPFHYRYPPMLYICLSSIPRKAHHPARFDISRHPLTQSLTVIQSLATDKGGWFIGVLVQSYTAQLVAIAECESLIFVVYFYFKHPSNMSFYSVRRNSPKLQQLQEIEARVLGIRPDI